jgi:hypothetical protein
MKLRLEDLVVASFETTFGTEPGKGLPTDDPDTNEPTPGTRCYDCP